MKRVVWKESAVVSIETRKGHHVLAQMSRDPYLLFFDVFRSDVNDFTDIDLDATPIRFCSAVTKQFLKFSSIQKLKGIKPRMVKELPSRWIHSNCDSRSVTVWPGTSHERTFISFGPGGALVEKEVLHQRGSRAHPSGVFDKVLIKNIDPKDDHTIDAHELTSLAIFPATNERLYLCELMKRNVDPDKDILFDRELPREYSRYIQLVVEQSESEQQALLAFYR